MELDRKTPDHEETGGFIRPPESGLFSPASSVGSSGGVSSDFLPQSRGRRLPTPRPTPLKAGGNKESMLRLFLDRRIRAIQRRGTLPSTTVMNVADELGDMMLVEAEEHGPEIGTGIGDTYGQAGYTSYGQLSKDLDKLVDLLWFSSTPSLQAQYFLNMALQAVSYIPSYPAAPKAMFRILDKLDIAFASLIKGVDIETGGPLPSFRPGLSALSMTDKVRLRGLVEKTRIIVAKAMDTDNEDEDDDEDEDEVEMNKDEARKGAEKVTKNELGDYKKSDEDKHVHELEAEELDEDLDAEGEFDMRIGQVYERTLSLLGGTINSTTSLNQSDDDCS